MIPTRLGPNPLYSARQPSSTPIRRIKTTVSTKAHSPPPVALRDAPAAADEEELGRDDDAAWRNMSDCRRVLTTSNGEVTMAPAIPPIEPAAECFHPCSSRFFRAGIGGEAVEGGTEDEADALGTRPAWVSDRAESGEVGALHPKRDRLEDDGVGSAIELAEVSAWQEELSRPLAASIEPGSVEQRQ